MSHSLTYSQLYKTLAIALCIAIVASTLPPVAGHVAYAAPLTTQHAASSPLAPRPSPLSISRLQSAYTPGEATSGALVVTFTVTNNQPPANVPELAETATLTDTVAALQTMQANPDPNLVRNILLVDTLTTHAALASATPRPDRRGNEYVWNLGDLAPLASITVTLVLSTPQTIADVLALDGGARAWGTLGDRAVSARACPVTLTPDVLGGEPMGPYLQSSVDANLYDEYVARQAGQLCQPTQAFQYARGLGYEAYKGSLRGARGTLWSQAGNSLDQSNLLIATLRGNGVPARYRHGALSTARAQELILSMFPTVGGVVGYVPEGTEVSDPANDPALLAEAQDHWWAEAYVNGAWTAMDPSFSYAAPGQTFATPIGEALAQVPDAMQHKVTISLETESYDMLSYLYAGFVYTSPLTYTFSTAELVGQPITLKHLVNTQRPPFGCLIFCWTHNTYAPYLRVGDQPQVIMGHQFWELLSDYPFGQHAVTAEWLIFDVQDTGGNTRRYTREIADRIGMEQRASDYKIRGMIPELLTANVLEMFGPSAPALLSELDSHTIYFNPSLLSPEYAAHVGENLLAAAPRVLSAQAIVTGLEDIERIWRGETLDISGWMQLAEASDTVQDSTQAINRMMGASFIAFSDAAAGELAKTSLVRAYPDSPRITITSLVILPTQTVSGTSGVPVQSMDLLHDSLRAIAYPGQARSAEWMYRLTRGMNEAFLEKTVGEGLMAHQGQSAAGVLQAATAQGIPLMYVDAQNLELLASAPLSDEAKARIVQAIQQGYGILTPERMVTWNGEQTTAWWQIDPESGETVGVGEDGTHQFLVIFTEEARLLAIFAHYADLLIIPLMRRAMWEAAIQLTANHFLQLVQDGATGQPLGWHTAFQETKQYMQSIVVRIMPESLF